LALVLFSEFFAAITAAAASFVGDRNGLARALLFSIQTTAVEGVGSARITVKIVQLWIHRNVQ
jgi:hypothetical protein